MSVKAKGGEVDVCGVPICRGIAVGIPFSFTFIEDEIPDFTIIPEDIEGEIARYRRAISRSREDLRRLQKQLEDEGIVEGVAILDAHQQMMHDPLLTTNIEDKIRETGKNAEHIFQQTINHYQKKFNALTDPFFRERSRDMQDISRRVMGYLRDSVRVSLADIPENSIVFAKELVPSDIAEAKTTNVVAFVTEVGGPTSHAAIVAKAKGIPYVTNVAFEQIETSKAQCVVVDGRTGSVIFNPSSKTIDDYRNLQKELASHLGNLKKTYNRKAETCDGYPVEVSGNVDMLNEIDELHEYGGNGIGLFRSESVFLANETFPSEEEQFFIYKEVVEKLKGHSVVIRTFDIGGDKFLLSHAPPVESNPFLGCRAIRFLLKERDIFKTQLRAILRASAYGNVSIMFPMISALSEVVEAKEVVEEAKRELRKEGESFAKHVPIGCMIEVPSAAIVADLLSQECDFLSIGTNDLVQYSLAVDRGNQEVSGMYTPTDPSVLRLIKLVVSEANHQGIHVTVCGEVAADPRFTPLLLGLGVHELSVAPRYIPTVKNAIRHTSIVAASGLAEKVLSLTTAEEIQELLTKEYQEHVPEDCFYNY